MTQALAALGGLFGNQSRRTVERQPIPSAIEAMTVAKDSKHLNKLRKQAREERLLAMLNQPEVLGYIMAIGGLVIANNIPFSSNAGKNEMLQSIASSASILMGLGHAGVGDFTSLSVAVTTGAALLGTGLIENLTEGILPDFTDMTSAINPANKIFPWLND